jgi:hypothetical protein
MRIARLRVKGPCLCIRCRVDHLLLQDKKGSHREPAKPPPTRKWPMTLKLKLCASYSALSKAFVSVILHFSRSE